MGLEDNSKKSFSMESKDDLDQPESSHPPQNYGEALFTCILPLIWIFTLDSDK
jgi:hypothetical protein